MREQLLKNGYARVFHRDDRVALMSVVVQLMREGHAAHCDVNFTDGRCTSLAAHHYLTCTACRVSRDPN